MLDTFFTQIKVRSRMESGPIGPYLSEIAAMLHRDGYARSTIRRHLRAADRFGAWILKGGMSIVDINASIVDRYLEDTLNAALHRRPFSIMDCRAIAHADTRIARCDFDLLRPPRHLDRRASDTDCPLHEYSDE